MDGAIVAYPVALHGGDWARVVATSLDTGKSREVARTGFPGGLINGVAVAGRWVVYVDQSARQSDSEPSVLWRVVATEPGTDHRIVLSSNGHRPDPYVPIVRSQDGHVFWTQAERDRTAREQAWEPGWAKPREETRRTSSLCPQLRPGSTRKEHPRMPAARVVAMQSPYWSTLRVIIPLWHAPCADEPSEAGGMRAP